MATPILVALGNNIKAPPGKDGQCPSVGCALCDVRQPQNGEWRCHTMTRAVRRGARGQRGTKRAVAHTLRTEGSERQGIVGTGHPSAALPPWAWPRRARLIEANASAARGRRAPEARFRQGEATSRHASQRRVRACCRMTVSMARNWPDSLARLSVASRCTASNRVLSAGWCWARR